MNCTHPKTSDSSTMHPSNEVYLSQGLQYAVYSNNGALIPGT